MIFGTVITSSHWSRAKLLAASIRRSMPEAKLIVCIVERTIPENIREEITEVSDIWLARTLRKAGDFDKRIFRYKSFEACCSVKPLLLDELITRFPEENHFVLLDSDMEVLSPFEEIQSLLAENPILLSPHHLNSKASPFQYDYSLLFGIYNAGLLAVNSSDEAKRFVEWWITRTHRHCLFDWGKGLFAEQRWLNYAPVYFHAAAIKHPGYNVAPWNLHEKEITRSAKGEWLVNDQPLRCFHYHNHSQLLKNCREGEYKNRCALGELVSAYVNTLRDIEKQETKQRSWSYDCFESGEKIDKKIRKIYAENTGYEELPMSPFRLSNHSFII
jgi:hypothetical protein